MPRTIEFDREEKLHDAMMLFWRKGFEATSLRDLVQGLGINRFSIYNTYGDKQALFEQALEYYERQVFRKSLCPLLPPSRGLAGLETYLSNLREGLRTGRVGEVGCLVQNTALERGAVDASVRACVQRVLASLQTALRDLLLAAREQGQIKPDHDIEGCTVFLVAQIQGIIMAHRIFGTEAMERCLNFLQAEIKQWSPAAGEFPISGEGRSEA